MPALAQRMSRAKPSAIMVIADKAKTLKAAGRSIVNFSIGVPNFLPGDHVYEAARAALKTDSGGYGSNRGRDDLLDAFLAHLKDSGFTGYARANLATGIGAKQVLYNLCEALLDPGDEIVFPTPYWTSYMRHRRDPRREDHPPAVPAGAELQAHAGATRQGAGEQAESFPVQ